MESDLSNINAIIPVSLRGAKKIHSLCSEQAVRSHTVNVIARSEEDSFACHCEPQRGEAIPHEKVEIATLRSQ